MECMHSNDDEQPENEKKKKLFRKMNGEKQQRIGMTINKANERQKTQLLSTNCKQNFPFNKT